MDPTRQTDQSISTEEESRDRNTMAPGNKRPPDEFINTASALSYWSSVPADSISMLGLLGGYPQISRIDLQGSANFVGKLRAISTKTPTAGKKFRRAVDCGAGIGRITAGLLVNVAEVVDVVEAVKKFTDEIQRGEGLRAAREEGRIGDVVTLGLEDWQPAKEYDLIWNQWCLGHLTDRQLVDYLKRARGMLAEDGWIVVKENLSTDVNGEDFFDETDSSVTRTHAKFRRIFDKAGLRLVLTELQKGFPKSLPLLPVRTYALRPLA